MKKLSIFMLVLAMAIPVSASETFLRGDVDYDGKTNIGDVTALINYLLSHEWPANEPVEGSVDLGLPSGTLWAAHNLGATKPEESGDFYAWGDLTPNKEYYWWETTAWVYIVDNQVCFSKYNTDSNLGTVDNKTELDPEDDIAYVSLGQGWRMPSKEQVDELIANCTCKWTEMNGVNGYYVTGPNGNSIFLPAAGFRIAYNLNDEGNTGNYWIRNLVDMNGLIIPNSAFKIYFDSGSFDWAGGNRSCGYPIRPVYNYQMPTDGFERGDVDQDDKVNINDVTTLINYLLSHVWPAPEPVEEYVDLGLPNGTLWATHNVGATKPQEFGDYFAWGETVPKEIYTASTYQWAYIENGKVYFSKYNTKSELGTVDDKTELDPEDDAAYVNMGPEWRMPTREQIEELVDNCTWEWTQLKGVNGLQVTGPNGKSIFLPAAGESLKYSIGEAGYYWSRSMSFVPPIHYFPQNANSLTFGTDYMGLNGASRSVGFTVRAVRASQE